MDAYDATQQYNNSLLLHVAVGAAWGFDKARHVRIRIAGGARVP
jgi:hypothetical protein